MRTRPRSAQHRGRPGAWRRRTAGALTALAGTLTIVAQLSTAGIGDDFTLPFHSPFEHVLGLAGGLGMLAIARAMLRGSRRAADLALVVVLILGLARWFAGEGLADVGLDLGAAGLLALSRDAFPCVRPLRSVFAPGAIAAGAGAVAYVLRAASQLQRPGGTDVDRAVSVASPVVRHAGRGVVSSAWWLAPTGAVPVAVDLLVAVAVIAAALCLRTLLRPHPGSGGHTTGEHRRAAEIVARWGRDSLDPFALREDKSFHFAAGGFVAYRTLRETAVVAGDPIAPPGRGPAVLASFLSHADGQGWRVVVTAASGRELRAFRRLGLRALRIGDEAVVDPRRFSLEGRAVRKVRQSVARVRRHGWAIDVVGGHEVTPGLLQELSAVEQEWRASQGRLHGFAMTLGRLWGAEEDRRSVYVVSRDGSGRMRAFLRFAEYEGGLSLDAMRRTGGEQPNGLTEALVVAALEHARAVGLREVSLNFAGFAHVMAADAALDRGQRVLRWILERAHGRFQLERLVRFNAKFDPEWRPRYLLYERRANLPLAALRVLQAEAYVRPPRARELKTRWQPRPSEVATLAIPPPSR